MWLLVVCFFLGIALGCCLQGKEGLFPFFSLASEWLVRALLFFLGIALGCNHSILLNLGRLGLVSLALALGAVAGSIFFVWPLQKHWMREGRSAAGESHGDR